MEKSQTIEYEVMHHAHFIDIQAEWKEIERFDLRKQWALARVASIVGDSVYKALDMPYTIIIANKSN